MSANEHHSVNIDGVLANYSADKNIAPDSQERVTDHFATVGFLIPSHSGQSFKVIAQVEGKQVFIGLVSKESLERSLSLEPMTTIRISRFVNPEPSRKRVHCIREADPEKLSAGGSF